jgi:hypothetical protein
MPHCSILSNVRDAVAFIDRFACGVLVRNTHTISAESLSPHANDGA